MEAKDVGDTLYETREINILQGVENPSPGVWRVTEKFIKYLAAANI